MQLWSTICCSDRRWTPLTALLARGAGPDAAWHHHLPYSRFRILPYFTNGMQTKRHAFRRRRLLVAHPGQRCMHTQRPSSANVKDTPSSGRCAATGVRPDSAARAVGAFPRCGTDGGTLRAPSSRPPARPHSLARESWYAHAACPPARLGPVRGVAAFVADAAAERAHAAMCAQLTGRHAARHVARHSAPSSRGPARPARTPEDEHQNAARTGRNCSSQCRGRGPSYTIHYSPI